MTENPTNLQLLFQTLKLVSNFDKEVSKLDIRNNILAYLLHYLHKNSEVDGIIDDQGNRKTIRILPDHEEQYIAESIMTVLLSNCTNTKEEKENFKDEIRNLVEKLKSKKGLKLKSILENILETNTNFEINQTTRTIDNSNPHSIIKDIKGYYPIYESVAGRTALNIHFKLITVSRCFVNPRY